MNLPSNELKNFFEQKNINYDTFLDNHKIELLWNTLIYEIYRNQLNINIIEVENEIKKIKENKSEEELKKFNENILNQKKEEKLNLFSRSHFSNIENTIQIAKKNNVNKKRFLKEEGEETTDFQFYLGSN